MTDDQQALIDRIVAVMRDIGHGHAADTVERIAPQAATQESFDEFMRKREELK